MLQCLKQFKGQKKKKVLLNKYIRALNNISTVYNNTKQKQRHELFSPIRESGLSLSEIQSLGFKATKFMNKSCHSSNDERPQGGRPKLDKKIKNEIELHMESLSHIQVCMYVAANRYLKRENTNAFYRDIPLTEAFTIFRLKDEILFTTFYK